MNRQLSSELYKIRTTRTVASVLAAMLTLVIAAVLLHAFGLSAVRLSGRDDQLGIFLDVGVNLGTLFAALLGALSITVEIRTGTIRPTFLAAPRRSIVVASKAVTSLATGFILGAVATAAAAGVGAIALDARGLPLRVSAGDYTRLIAGGAAAAALWAVIGLGVGAVVRAQVATVVALFAWSLFVENLLIDLPAVHRFAPGALAQALAGQQRPGILNAPAVAAVLLALYAAVAIGVGRSATVHHDVA